MVQTMMGQTGGQVTVVTQDTRTVTRWHGKVGATLLFGTDAVDDEP